MKPVVIIVLLIFFCMSTISYAGNGDLTVSGSLGVGTSSPAASAALDVTNITKGFLPPRMTTAQRNAINNGYPAAGLLIYNTDNNAYNFYTGTGSSWTALPVTDSSGNIVGNITGNATSLGGNATGFYQNASNLNAGTVPAARLSIKTQQLTDNPLAALFYRGYSDYSYTGSHSGQDYYYYLTTGTLSISTVPEEFLLSIIQVFPSGINNTPGTIVRSIHHVTLGRRSSDGLLVFTTRPLLQWGNSSYAYNGATIGGYSPVYGYTNDYNSFSVLYLRVFNPDATHGELQIKLREYSINCTGGAPTTYIALHRLDLGNLSETAMHLTTTAAW